MCWHNIWKDGLGRELLYILSRPGSFVYRSRASVVIREDMSILEMCRRGPSRTDLFFFFAVFFKADIGFKPFQQEAQRVEQHVCV